LEGEFGNIDELVCGTQGIRPPRIHNRPDGRASYGKGVCRGRDDGELYNAGS
jgi:hypothetical protein